MNTYIEDITKADYITIPFKPQKTGSKYQTIAQHKFKRATCPVKVWSSPVNLFSLFKELNKNTPINCYKEDDQTKI